MTDTGTLTFEDVAGNRLNYGRVRWAADHGDTTARDLLTQVDGAYAGLESDAAESE